MVSRIATGNSNHEPTKKEVALQLIKFAAGAVAVLSGAAFLSTLGIFTGDDYLTPGLTPEQRILMDSHNRYHSGQDSLHAFTTGLFGHREAEVVEEVVRKDWKKLFDDSIATLPGELAHKH